MHCPFCQAAETKVVDSRLVEEENKVRRRRECLHCNERFTTYEVVDLVLPRIIKRDGSRIAFDADKLRGGILKALEKRPVAIEQVEAAVQRILHQLRASGDQEVASQHIGELVMVELRQLDEVAYVRFASVYRSFQDVDAFREEIQKLKQHSNNE